MKRSTWTGLVVALLCVAALALADYNVLDKGSYYQNATNGSRVNSTGDLRVEVTNPPQNFVVFQPDLINCILTARLAGGLPPSPAVLQDSSAAVDVRGANGLALMVYPTFDDSVSAVTLALQVRWHYSATVDSQSTFIEQATKSYIAAASATARDSIGSLLFQPAASNGPSRYSVTSVDSLATPDEQVLVLANVSGVNRGRMVRIRMPDGLSGSSLGPYVSFRVRYLNGYGTTAFIPWGNGVSGFEPQMRLRMTLVGWR